MRQIKELKNPNAKSLFKNSFFAVSIFKDLNKFTRNKIQTTRSMYSHRYMYVQAHPQKFPH